MRIRLFWENQAKDCQEFEEMRRNCCEETDRARPARIDDLSMHQERNPATVSQLLTQIQDWQNKANSLSDARILRSWNSEQLWSEPRSQSTFYHSKSQDYALPRFWIAARYTENYGYFRKRLWTTACSRRTNLFLSSTIRRIWQPLLWNWDIPGNTKRPESEMRREPQNSSILAPRFQSGGGIPYHTGGTYSHGGMIDYPRFLYLELHLGKFPDSMEFQSWKVNFKTEVSSKSADPHFTMQWTKEIWDSKVNWRTYDIAIDYRAKRLLRLRYAYAMVASALKRLLDKHVHLRKRVCVEEQRAQKYDRFLRGRQNCLDDLRAFPCNRSLWNGTRTLRFVQYTIAEWRRPRLRRSMGSSPSISKRYAFRHDPGRIAQVKITGLCSASDRLGFVRSGNRSKQWTDKFFTIEDICKTSYWSDDDNSKLQKVPNEVVERGAVTKSQKGKKAYVERKVGECFQWKTHGQMFKRRLM